MSVCLIDTSVFCELLAVPNMSRRHKEMVDELADKLKAQETLLLPMTTILETGNHIGQNGDGRQRRQTAERFLAQVGMALQGQSPFVPTPLFSREELAGWLGEFPDWAMRSDSRGKGSGLGDLSIVKAFDRQCELTPFRRVYIWSLDELLARYDRDPAP
ncbi:hypothetical protein [Archangium sp.]|uniref:hypothetical protein n=1 Tax=Archangium sp. TaxID=1872627 RepID=UPI002EDB8C74